VSLAAQKFISDIANDALQHCKMKGGANKNKGKVRKKAELTSNKEKTMISKAKIYVGKRRD
jgi:hypothetical protein